MRPFLTASSRAVNRLSISLKLGLMLVVPVVAVLVLAAAGWRIAERDVAAAEDDRRIAEVGVTISQMPWSIVAETHMNRVLPRGDNRRDLRIFLLQMRRSLDALVSDYHEGPSQRVLPDDLRGQIDAELAAIEELRARVDADGVPDAVLVEAIRRQNLLAERSFRWLADQHVDDPDGAWRMLTTTGPSNRAVVVDSVIGLEAFLKGTLSRDGAEALRDSLVELRAVQNIEEVLLPRGLGFSLERQREMHRRLQSTTQQLLALEGRDPPAPLAPDETRQLFTDAAATLDAFTDRYDALADEVVGRADARIAGARRNQITLASVVVVVLMFALAAAVILARNIARRVQGVADHAEQLNAGVIDEEWSAPGGSDEIATLGEAIERLGQLLVRFIAQNEAIAAGRLDDPALQTALPGVLGRALQGSVDRVADSSAQLLQLATHDDLTGLLDRAGLARAVDALAGHRDDRAMSVFFIDLDGFKAVNDEFGHAVGDEVLIEAARRIVAVAREDDSVARLGGDEFVLLAPGVGDDGTAAGIAERLVEAMAEPMSFLDGIVGVTASVGWATAPVGSSLATAIEAADGAMYDAKRRGSGSARAEITAAATAG